jgi:hypothetical protein
VSNSSKKKNKPRDVLRQEALIEMERLIVSGFSHRQIQQWLGIPKATYQRYLRALFEEDKKILEARRKEDVLTVYAILKARLQEMFQEGFKIIRSDTTTNADKLHALEYVGQVAVILTRVNLEAPITLAWNKEQAQRQGELPMPAGIIMEKDIDGNMVAITSQEQHQAFLAKQKEEQMRRQKRSPLFLPAVGPTQEESIRKEQALKDIFKKEEQ